MVSIKHTENKFKREKNGDFTTSMCPMCKNNKETRSHYKYDCPEMLKFRKAVARTVNKEDFSNEEWTLESASESQSIKTTIAKARWLYHCERCNLDHNKRKRINIDTLLIRLKLRMQLVDEIKKEEKEKETQRKKNEQQKKRIESITTEVKTAPGET